ncbi:hypothetical protein AGMMS49525_17770 [Bacteroidia bacterium]|nr:hypothetical protein AGMMS49525_17770 [Bacteroidia bacterium]
MNLTAQTGAAAYARKAKRVLNVKPTPPEGFMTGDEFERRVKIELKQLYKDHGLL